MRKFLLSIGQKYENSGKCQEMKRKNSHEFKKLLAKKSRTKWNLSSQGQKKSRNNS